MLNAMEAEEVAKLAEQEEDDPRRNFFGELNGEEQIFFLEQRIGRAFQQMMQTFNEMDREERKQMVDRALSRIRSEEGVGRDGQNRFEEADREIAERIAEAGLQSYLSDASAETKIDLAPLMEELQSVMGGMGGRPR
jgi:catalase